MHNAFKCCWIHRKVRVGIIPAADERNIYRKENGLILISGGTSYPCLKRVVDEKDEITLKNVYDISKQLAPTVS